MRMGTFELLLVLSMFALTLYGVRSVLRRLRSRRQAGQRGGLSPNGNEPESFERS